MSEKEVSIKIDLAIFVIGRKKFWVIYRIANCWREVKDMKNCSCPQGRLYKSEWKIKTSQWEQRFVTKPESDSLIGVMGTDEMGQPSPVALQSATISCWPPAMRIGEKCVSLREIPALDKEESEGAFFEEKCGKLCLSWCEGIRGRKENV